MEFNQIKFFMKFYKIYFMNEIPKLIINAIQKFFYFHSILIFIFFNKTPLYNAIEIGNIELVKLLLDKEGIDINLQCIHNFDFF